MILEYARQLLWNPTAPVPAGWPHGWPGTLLLFCIPGGLGVPSGVLLGNGAGLGPVMLTAVYFLSDVVMACVFEPMLRSLAFLARRVPRLARAGHAIVRGIERTTAGQGVSTPLAVVMTGFGAGLPFGRALATVAGLALVPAWLLTIGGDMLYFLLGMVSTLWFRDVLGDARMAVLAALIVMMVVPAFIRRWSRRTG